MDTPEDIALRCREFNQRLQARADAVNPVVLQIVNKAGYGWEHTGGGCMAWQRPMEDGGYLMISCELDIDGNPDAPQWTVGRYGKDGEGWIVLEPDFTLTEAVHIGPQIPFPRRADGVLVEADFATVDAAKAALNELSK